MKKHKETDLYEPVAEFLREKGFKVRAEVKGCDVTALKDDQLVVVELKLSFTMKLLMQAADRLSVTDYVYVAIPRPAFMSRKNVNSPYFRSITNILKRLSIGLLLVALDSPVMHVEPVLHPMSYNLKNNRVNRLNIIKEIDSRVGDFNTGGSARAKILTANKEKSIKIACILKTAGAVSTRQLRFLGMENREIMLLSKNYYGWFERVETGVYKLSQEGESAIANPGGHMKKLVDYYMEIKPV
jgi:hypothetical protein